MRTADDHLRRAADYNVVPRADGIKDLTLLTGDGIF
jgi:hypothetical protein